MHYPDDEHDKEQSFFIFLQIYQQLLANCVIIINVNKAGQKELTLLSQLRYTHRKSELDCLCSGNQVVSKTIISLLQY